MSNQIARENTSIDLVVLVTDLFPDAATLEAALQQAGPGSTLRRHDVDPNAMDETAWDLLLADIMAAKTVVTL